LEILLTGRASSFSFWEYPDFISGYSQKLAGSGRRLNPVNSQYLGTCDGTTYSDIELRECLAAAIKRSGTSRDQIADRMTSALGRTVTRSQLNDFTAQEKSSARFPAAFIPAFCVATGDDSLQLLMLSPRLRALLELGENEVNAAGNAQSKKRLIALLSGTPEPTQGNLGK
jgi:hypothetical protein